MCVWGLSWGCSGDGFIGDVRGEIGSLGIGSLGWVHPWADGIGLVHGDAGD